MSWYPCACCRYCPHCLGGVAPLRFQVDIAGVAAKVPPACGDCGDLNATYIVEPTADAVPGAFGGCWWDYTLATAVCGVARVVVGIGVYTAVPAAWIVAVYFVDASGNVLAAAAKVYASEPPDCMAFDAESLGPMTFYVVALGCDVSDSSVTIAALRPCAEE
jgi:hypothetical protein